MDFGLLVVVALLAEVLWAARLGFLGRFDFDANDETERFLLDIFPWANDWLDETDGRNLDTYLCGAADLTICCSSCSKRSACKYPKG